MSETSVPAVVAVIPARGGSKGVPRKNIHPLAGRPLIAYTIEAAGESRLLSRVILSTDDEEIARVAREWGGEVPFVRPSALATDDARTLPVVQHAVGWVEEDEGRRVDIVVLLQPTTPLRTADDIDRGISMLLQTRADSVVSVVDVGGNHPFRMKRLLADGRLINYIDQGFEDMRPRQELPPVYIRSGALYISRRDVVMEQDTMVGADCRGLVIPPERAMNIDTVSDLVLAEQALLRREEAKG